MHQVYRLWWPLSCMAVISQHPVTITVSTICFVFVLSAGLLPVQVTFREFNFGHLDFTFGYKDDLRHFVLSRLRARH